MNEKGLYVADLVAEDQDDDDADGRIIVVELVDNYY